MSHRFAEYPTRTDQDLYKLDTKTLRNWILIAAKVHENRSQITIEISEQCDSVVENVDVDCRHCLAIFDLNKIS